MECWKKLMDEYKNHIRIDNNTAWEIISSLIKTFSEHKISDEDEAWEAMKDFHEEIYGKHFNEAYAVYQVEKMHHKNAKGETITAPLFTHDYARKIYERDVKHISKDITCWDVYVALNAQYHDNINLYKKWFPNAAEDEIESKIIESTIKVWFEDEDASDTKTWCYFRAI